MLEIRNIDAYYGKVQVLSNVSLEVGKDEIISLIGANGAGKSTLMKTVMGLLRPKKGSVIFQGEDITKKHKNCLTRHCLRAGGQRGIPGDVGQGQSGDGGILQEIFFQGDEDASGGYV